MRLERIRVALFLCAFLPACSEPPPVVAPKAPPPEPTARPERSPDPPIAAVKEAIKDHVGALIGGDTDPSASADREKLFHELDRDLRNDKKGVVIRDPGFWVDTITSQYFAGMSRQSASHGRVITEVMDVADADGSPGKVPIVFHGALGYSPKRAQPLLVCVVADNQDAAAYLESNWLAHEVIKHGWIVAAVNESAMAEEPWRVAHAFVHLRDRFNVHPNRFYMEAEGAVCETIQSVAGNAIPDRLAALILREPTTAVRRDNADLYTVIAFTDGENAMADVAAWLDAHPGRTTPTEYSFTTATSEDDIASAWTGTLFIHSPAKRGDPVSMNVKYDGEANLVDVTATNLGEFSVYLNDDLLDLDRPVTIQVNGHVVAIRKFERSIRDMFETADNYGEYGRVFMAHFRGFAPAPPAEAGSDDADDK